MGAWGTAVFSDDAALDVREEWRDAILDGLNAEDATARLLEDFDDHLGDDEDEKLFWTALAAAQFETGRLLPHVRDRALASIEPFEVGDVVRVSPEDGPGDALVLVVGHADEPGVECDPVVAALDWDGGAIARPRRSRRLPILPDPYAPRRRVLIWVTTPSKQEVFGPHVGEVIASGVSPSEPLDHRQIARTTQWGLVSGAVNEARRLARR